MVVLNYPPREEATNEPRQKRIEDRKLEN